MTKKIILIAVLLVLLAIVFIQNPGDVSYKLYFWRVTLSQMILLPLMLLAGFFIGYFVAHIKKPRS